MEEVANLSLERFAVMGDLPTYEQMLSQALLAERSMVLQLRNKKIISDDVLRRIQRDLDLAELRLNQS